MALLVAPYNDGMKLGSGFNSYTKSICIDHAVIRDDTAAKYSQDDSLPTSSNAEVAQSVTFKTEVIERVSDLTDILNINGSLTVKAGNIANANGTGNFINSNKLKTSDLNLLISCKVVNQTIMENNLDKFVPLPNLRPEDFTDVYGDCFISGFQVGGEFNALVSIKVRDKSQIDEISAKATLAFTTPGFTDKSATSDNSGGSTDSTGSGGLSISADAQIAKNRNDVLSENEVTISVSWTGGGQDLKSPTSDWNFDTLRAAAIKFPELVAQTPVRTNAILRKYTALKSFYTSRPESSPLMPLSYENAGAYTDVLQDACLDYRHLYKQLHLLGNEVDAGKKILVAVPSGRVLPIPEKPAKGQNDAEEQAKSDATSHTDGSEAVVATPTTDKSANSEEPKSFDIKDAKQELDHTTSFMTKAKQHYAQMKPYPILEAYSPTIMGLENAKRDIRIMMGRIVNEVDAVSKNPYIATLEDRGSPFMMPLLFKQFLPSGEVVKGVY